MPSTEAAWPTYASSYSPLQPTAYSYGGDLASSTTPINSLAGQGDGSMAHLPSGK